MTKDEIYSRMAEAYAEKAGFDPADAADIGLRLQVLAGEMETVLREVDKVRAAAFPQTAGGEALDLHAGERGLERKPAVQAEGALTFSRATALTYDVDIPAGTVCAASRAAVEFETTEAATLTAGMLSVTVKARAVQGGRAYNAAIGTVDTLVAPPAGIETVTNETPFTGGTDAETDDAPCGGIYSGEAGVYVCTGRDGVHRGDRALLCGAGGGRPVRGGRTDGGGDADRYGEKLHLDGGHGGSYCGGRRDRGAGGNLRFGDDIRRHE